MPKTLSRDTVPGHVKETKHVSLTALSQITDQLH